MSLIDDLLEFDGRSVEPLEALAERVRVREGIVDELIALTGSGDGRLEVAASWVLKRFRETGMGFSSGQGRKLTGLLGRVSRWEAKLHLLQMLDGLEIPARDVSRLVEVLRGQLSGENKLIRAWSYHGLWVLGEQHPRLRLEVVRLVKDAQRDEAASVRARVRNLWKVSPWLREG